MAWRCAHLSITKNVVIGCNRFKLFCIINDFKASSYLHWKRQRMFMFVSITFMKFMLLQIVNKFFHKRFWYSNFYHLCLFVLSIITKLCWDKRPNLTFFVKNYFKTIHVWQHCAEVDQISKRRLHYFAKFLEAYTKLTFYHIISIDLYVPFATFNESSTKIDYDGLYDTPLTWIVKTSGWTSTYGNWFWSIKYLFA